MTPAGLCAAVELLVLGCAEGRTELSDAGVLALAASYKDPFEALLLRIMIISATFAALRSDDRDVMVFAKQFADGMHVQHPPAHVLNILTTALAADVGLDPDLDGLLDDYEVLSAMPAVTTAFAAEVIRQSADRDTALANMREALLCAASYACPPTGD